MTDLSRRIASLTPKQRALLEKRMQAAGLKAAKADAIPVLPKADAYELSSGQQRLWFIDQLAPGSPAYNIPFAGRLAGPLDVDVLQRALDEIVRRHEILRTTFEMRDGRPVQVVAESVKAPLRYDDLTSLPRDSRETEAEQRINDEARIPFDLQHGPVLRIRLIRIDPEDHMLLVTMPHIVTDAWSMAVFFRELPALYEAFAAGKPSPLPELPIQFRDYAAWQKSAIDQQRLDELTAFWKKELEGAPAMLELAGDFAPAAVHRSRGRRYEVGIPSDLTAAVRELAQREGVTMFMMMLAAFSILLERYSGQRDILIGSPVATRERVEAEGLIGFFINTVVFRAQLEGNPSFRALLARVRERTLAAFAHQELPFEKLVETLGLERTMNHQPLTQVTLVLQNVHIPPPQFERLRLTDFSQTDSRTAKVDLMLGLWESGEDLRGWFEYNTDLFRGETIERMARHFVTLLRSIVADPSRAIDDLALMDEQERREVLVEWNATSREYPRDKTISELLREQVETRGDAIALECGEERVSYRELGERVSAVAEKLGDVAGARVGMALERSIDLVVAMAAVLEAGGTYVPIDPQWPEERRRYVIDDAGIALVLESGGNAAAFRAARTDESRRLGATWTAEAIASALKFARLSRRGNRIRKRRRLPPHSTVRERSRDRGSGVACIIYTSGSTGKPKGVMVEHRSIVRLVMNNPVVDLGPGAAILQYAPATFDASTFEIWYPLLNGARLVIAPPGKLSLEELGTIIRTRGITTVTFAAGLYHAMIDERLDDLRGLREFLAGGEALSAGHVKRLLREIPTLTAINGYGPTEATTLATCYRIESPGQIDDTVPIGRAIANTTAYVLDERLQPLPVNLAGELYIGGDALARGYVNAPTLTAERFIDSPYGRLYRTGDRVRWNSRGQLEFLGRFDEQLKVRGFRVEPGEIESVLREHDSVADAAVIGRKDGVASTTTLIAFVTPARGDADALRSVDVDALRTYLRGRVPEHLVPAQFAALDALPRTPNDKVDRKALQRFLIQPQRPEQREAAAQTSEEETLLRIWADVLKVPPAGVHDNFFELGGDSILALIVVSRAREAGLVLTPASLFEHPTVAGLAAFAVTHAAAALMQRENENGPLPLSPIARWFFETIDRDVHYWNLAFPLRLQKPHDLVEKALRAVIRHHAALRMRAERDQGGQWRLWIVPPEDEPPLRLQRAGTREDLNALHASLDLVAGPIVRAAVVEDELVLIAHHLAVDAVSWRILAEDFLLAIAALERGQEPVLPPVTTSVRSWHHLLSELPVEPEPAAKSFAALPRDRRGENREESALTLRRDLSAEMLQEATKAYRMRVDELVLAGYVSALARWTGGDAIRVDVEGYGRDTRQFSGVDLSRTVGWFTTISPLHVELRGTEPRELLTAVKERVRAVSKAAAVPPHSGAEASFNYLGTIGDDVPIGSLDVGQARSPRAPRPYLLSLDAAVLHGSLSLHLTGSTAVHDAAALERVADLVQSEIERLIEHCLHPDAGGFTPSDFPEADLDEAELQKLLGSLS